MARFVCFRIKNGNWQTKIKRGKKKSSCSSLFVVCLCFFSKASQYMLNTHAYALWFSGKKEEKEGKGEEKEGKGEEKEGKKKDDHKNDFFGGLTVLQKKSRRVGIEETKALNFFSFFLYPRFLSIPKCSSKKVKMLIH